MTRNRAERDHASLQRRLEVLRLPVVPLQHCGFLKPDDLRRWHGEPDAVGVGPDGTALAVWPDRESTAKKQVTTYGEAGEVIAAVELTTDLTVSFVQPLPYGALLLAAGRTLKAARGAEVWSADGNLIAAGNLGDAIEELLTTPSGKVWVGYFDEAMSGTGPQTHGLARFGPDLTPDWLYPQRSGLPEVFDCYALNVHGENAYCCPYTSFHVISVERNQATDLGPAPQRLAHGLLIEGPRAALLGGWGPEYDLVTPLQLNRDGVTASGPPSRIVLPDGTEARRVRYTCRGPNLHAFIHGTWYQTSLNDVLLQT